MKKILIIVLFAFLAIFLLGCAVPQGNYETNTVPEPIMIQTSANWTYIVLNLEGSVEENASQIGNAIYQWEQANPDKKIVSLVPIYQNSSYGPYYDTVDGLSIYYSEFKSY